VQIAPDALLLALADDENLFFQRLAFLDFGCKRRGPLADAAFEGLLERFQTGQQPDDHEVTPKCNAGVPGRNELVGIPDPRGPVAHQPTGDTQHRDAHGKRRAEIPKGERNGEQIENRKGNFVPGEIIQETDYEDNGECRSDLDRAGTGRRESHFEIIDVGRDP